MTGRTSLVLILTFCGVAAWAQNTAPAPSSATNGLFERVNSSVCTIAAVDRDDNLIRRGSGFILKDSRLLVTNAHVLAGFERAEIRCSGQSAPVGKIRHYDGEVDLVLAEVGDLDVPGLALSGSARIGPGTEVYAFGSPYGLEGTITPGLTSAYREIGGHTYLQISNPISPGSSGGPVTDDRGDVIGVTVAALELAQNINFAIPASIVRDLPSVDLALSDLVPRREIPRRDPVDPLTPPEPAIASGQAEFLGHPFGSDCGDIAVSEYEQRLVPGSRKGLTRFSKAYSGELEMDINLRGTPATAIFVCDERFGLIGGHFEIVRQEESVAQIERDISRQYGAGIPSPVAETEARELGCLFNFSVPGSRFYRPSERISWQPDDRLRIDLLICGGSSNTTFVFYTDPMFDQLSDRTDTSRRRL